MDEGLMNFILSCKGIQPSLFLCYMTMRAEAIRGDGTITKLARDRSYIATSHTRASLASSTGLKESVVSKCLRTMLHRGWIRRNKDLGYLRTAYLLGDVKHGILTWYVTKFSTEKYKPIAHLPTKEEKVESASDAIRKKLSARESEKKAVKVMFDTIPDVKAGMKSGFRLLGSERVTGKSKHPALQQPKESRYLVLNTFKTLFTAKFGCEPVKCLGSISTAFNSDFTGVEHVFAGMLLMQLESSSEKAVKWVTFLIAEWERIKIALDLEGLPAYSVMKTSFIVNKVRDWMIDGEVPEKKIKKDHGTRYDPTEARPAEGWG